MIDRCWKVAQHALSVVLIVHSFYSGAKAGTEQAVPHRLPAHRCTPAEFQAPDSAWLKDLWVPFVALSQMSLESKLT